MKTVIIAAIAGITLMGTVGIATSAKADHALTPTFNNFEVLGGLEYAVDAEAFDGYVGGKYYAPEGVTLFSTVNFSKPSGVDATVDDMDFGVAYSIMPSTDLYVKVNVDSDFNRNDTIVGASFVF